MRTPVAIDLFAGCGGLSLGLRRAGFRVLAAVEIDPVAMETYALNHPEVRRIGTDVRRVSGPSLARALRLRSGQLDLLAACPPCQGFSSLRTLNGGRRVRDSRNRLMLDIARIARTLRPKAILMENVPQARRSTHFHTLCRRLVSLGYQVRYEVEDAADYGVAQRRRRLILLATRAMSPTFARHVAVRTTVRASIGHLPPAGSSGDPLHDVGESRSARVRALISRVPSDGGSRQDLHARWRLPCHENFDGFKDVYGRMQWDAPSPTITTGCVNPSKGRFLHPQENRAITLREAALLQSFPLSYRFGLEGGKFKTAEMIGNAVPPELARRQAAHLLRTLRTGGARVSRER